MKILFVGLGSIGKRHLNNFRSIIKFEAFAYRSTHSKQDDHILKDVKLFYDLDEALEISPDLVVISNPTNLHLESAIKAAKKSCNIFIEKPITKDENGLDELLELIKEKKIFCHVGFNFRFHPALIKIKKMLKDGILGKVYSCQTTVGQYLPDWHPNEDYRNSYSARSDLGGGVLLTLSHEIDYTYWLLGDFYDVFAMTEKLSNLEIDVEDTAILIGKTSKGASFEIHMDFLQRAPSRDIRLICENANLVWDYFSNKIEIKYPNNKKELITFDNFERNNMFIEEAKFVLDKIKNANASDTKFHEIKHIMDVIESSIKSHKTGKKIKLPEV